MAENAPLPVVSECETDFGVEYLDDGTFAGYEEAGTWRIEGDFLIETITEIWEMGGGPETEQIANPEPSRIRLDWRSPDAVNLLGAQSGGGYALVRCRPVVAH